MSKSKWKKILGKKWTFPAIYMIAAVLILAFMWWYQDPNDYPLSKDDLGLEEINDYDSLDISTLTEQELADKFGEVISVTETVEEMQWPVKNLNDVEVSIEFFDSEATEEELENAIVSYENELYPHTGIDLVSKDGKEFIVVAALSGEVIRAEKDPVVGYVVELKHKNDLVTVYSSLTDLKVSKGDHVEQGAEIALASKNIFEKEQGNHLHFEVRRAQSALNPYLFFDKNLDEVLEQLTTEN